MVIYGLDGPNHIVSLLFRKIHNYATAQTSDAVFIIGGEYTRDIVAEYKNDQWRKLDTLLQPRRAHGSVIIQNELFIIAGHSDTVDSS